MEKGKNGGREERMKGGMREGRSEGRKVGKRRK